VLIASLISTAQALVVAACGCLLGLLVRLVPALPSPGH
jgi:hypothetical protein